MSLLIENRRGKVIQVGIGIFQNLELSLQLLVEVN